MLNYEGIAKANAESIVKQIQSESKDSNYTYHTASIEIDAERNKLSVMVMRKDPLGIEYYHTEEVKLDPSK